MKQLSATTAATCATPISLASLPAIRQIAREGAVKSSSRSLLAWGAINLAAWLIFGGQNGDFLSNLSDSDPNIHILMYGGLFIGAAMLFFGLVGAASGLSLTILLDGLSLFGVGLWNVGQDFFAMSALQPYGYTIEKPGVFWIILGMCQIMWGCREIKRFTRMSAWDTAGVPEAEKETIKGAIAALVQKPEDITAGRVKGSITIRRPLGLDFLSRTDLYSGQIDTENGVFISQRQDDCFALSRKSLTEGSFGQNGTVTLTLDEDQTREISLGALSVLALKKWAGLPIRPTDISYLAAQGKATVGLLAPLLHDANAETRAAAVEALAKADVRESETLIVSALSDPGPGVRASALAALKAVKSKQAVAQSELCLRDPDPRVRKAAAQYLSVASASEVKVSIKEALEAEQDRGVRKELQRALKAA